VRSSPNWALRAARLAVVVVVVCPLAQLFAAQSSTAQSSTAPALASPLPHNERPATDATSVRTRDWACIRWYESRNNYRSVGDQYGAYQFTLGTWRMLGYRGFPNRAPASEQDQGI
jgi:hypothetical protein